ncbi:hypothetical protein B4U79_04725 [Dinothrombium tinctorium]|uniref:Uncharacterized protein n=1 Tax=Dinothrombium tinctorium TaxID=1965070 RepID=A0A3S3P3V8_9ACAR|nr:hypothetical protein B4U79_04725 [Dinothrombium tinctorium]
MRYDLFALFRLHEPTSTSHVSFTERRIVPLHIERPDYADDDEGMKATAKKGRKDAKLSKYWTRRKSKRSTSV